MSLPLWKRALFWLRRLFRRARQPRLPARASSAWGEHVELLPADVRAMLVNLSDRRGVVNDTVRNAIDDYGQLHAIIAGPGAGIDVVFDATLLADAETRLRSIVEDAPGLEAIIILAGRRRGDIKGRQAAGVAILGLRDRARLLTEVTSAALQWAAEPNEQTLAALREHANILGAPDPNR